MYVSPTPMCFSYFVGKINTDTILLSQLTCFSEHHFDHFPNYQSQSNPALLWLFIDLIFCVEFPDHPNRAWVSTIFSVIFLTAFHSVTSPDVFLYKSSRTCKNDHYWVPEENPAVIGLSYASSNVWFGNLWIDIYISKLWRNTISYRAEIMWAFCTVQTW